MDYTDIYLRPRRKEGAPPQTSSGANEGDANAEQRLECMLKGAFSVQQLVDRVDELSKRIRAFDEKMVNLTKLVKLAQELQEEKERDLRHQVHDLHSRLRRLEQSSVALNDLDRLKESVTAKVHEEVRDACRNVLHDVEKAREEGKGQIERTKEYVEGALRDAKRDFEGHLSALRQEVGASNASRTETQTIFCEKLALIEKTLQDFEASAARESLRVPSLEKKIDSISEALSPLRHKLDITTEAVAALGSERAQTRAELMEEIDATRQWATRNLQRVKQHVEMISSDVEQLQNGQVDLDMRLSRVSCQANIECKRLRTKLSHKARVAEALDNIVHKEICKVEDVALRHRSLRMDASAVKDEEC